MSGALQGACPQNSHLRAERVAASQSVTSKTDGKVSDRGRSNRNKDDSDRATEEDEQAEERPHVGKSEELLSDDVPVARPINNPTKNNNDRPIEEDERGAGQPCVGKRRALLPDDVRGARPINNATPRPSADHILDTIVKQ